jgi:predicted SAM-dependent methyltransferase
VQPGSAVDFVGDCSDLSQFADGSVAEIYASHVLEHLGYQRALPHALAEFHRVLEPGGRALISVPDFELVCRLFVEPSRTAEERYHLMRIAFGGQVDPYDFHYVGLTQDILGTYLRRAGFAEVERVGEFGLFEDTSSLRVYGTLISLNLIASKRG